MVERVLGSATLPSTTKIGDYMARLLYGGYGHHPHGKQYVYWGSDNNRTGQNVNVPVTNWRTGKTYNTMFTIQRTSGSTMGENEADRLKNKGIYIKSINGTDVMTLPGAQEWSSKKEWAEWSDLVHEENIKNRLAQFNPSIDTMEAKARLKNNFQEIKNETNKCSSI